MNRRRTGVPASCASDTPRQLSGIRVPLPMTRADLSSVKPSIGRPLTSSHLRLQHTGDVGVHKQIRSAESYRPRRQRALSGGDGTRDAGRPLIGQRGKAVAAKRRQARAADPGKAGSGDALPSAHVKVQAIAGNDAAAPCRLHVRVVPGAFRLRHADERIARQPRPVKAVTAESDAKVVRLLSIGGSPR